MRVDALIPITVMKECILWGNINALKLLKKVPTLMTVHAIVTIVDSSLIVTSVYPK